MGSGAGQAITKYALPGAEVVGGAASEYFAPGNPIGLGLIGSGGGQLVGGAVGGNQGQALGGGLGGLAGMGGGMLGGNSALASLASGAGGASAPGAFPGPSASLSDFAGSNGAPSSASGSLSQGLNSPEALQMLPQLMQMFNQQGGQSGQQRQQAPQAPKGPSIPPQVQAMGPQQMNVPTQAPGQHNTNSSSNASTSALLAYLRSQGMLNG